MRISIDAIHDKTARIDVGGQMMDFPIEVLPEGSKEGDILAFIKLDATQVLKDGHDRIQRMLNKNTDSGDFDL
ncbi:MAG: hypothetical protein WC966_00940 [Bradymonadales bacterium]|jgi:hypothetical protein